MVIVNVVIRVTQLLKKLVVSSVIIGYNSIASRNAGLDYGSLVGLVQWKPVNRVRIER